MIRARDTSFGKGLGDRAASDVPIECTLIEVNPGGGLNPVPGHDSASDSSRPWCAPAESADHHRPVRAVGEHRGDAGKGVAIISLVQPYDCVPRAVEGEVATRQQDAVKESLVIVAEPDDPGLRMEDTTPRGTHGHDRLLQEREDAHAGSRWQSDAGRVTAHGDSAGVGPERVENVQWRQAFGLRILGQAPPRSAKAVGSVSRASRLRV